MTFPVVAGQDYLLAVDARDAGTHPFTLALTLSPPNDARANAIPLDTVISGTTVAATKEAGESGAGHSVWYRWTAPRSGPAVIDTCVSLADTQLSVYPDGSGPALASDDDEPGCGYGQNAGHGSKLTLTAVAGTSYLIDVDGGEGFFELRVSPANDTFTSAQALQPGGFGYADLREYTAEPGEPAHAGSAAARSAWYAISVTRSGLLTVDGCGSAPARMAAYEGDTLSTLSPVLAQDGSSCPAGLGSRLRFFASAGKSYRSRSTCCRARSRATSPSRSTRRPSATASTTR